MRQLSCAIALRKSNPEYEMLDQLDREWARRTFANLAVDLWDDLGDLYEALLTIFTEEGTLVFALEWDSGGPGAGAGIEQIYAIHETFVAASVDFGLMGPFESLDAAIGSAVATTSGGNIRINDSTTEVRWPQYPLLDLIARLDLEQRDRDSLLCVNGEDWPITLLLDVQAALRRMLEAAQYDDDVSPPDRALTNVPPNGLVLWELAGPESARRRTAAFSLLGRARKSNPENDYYDSMRPILIEEWNALGPLRPFCCDGLVQAFLTEESMVAMEAIAMALALEGEEGLTALVSLAASDDFVYRHKAAVGIGVLDRSARWSVPSLINALREEHQPLVVFNLLNAIGRIGGPEALEFLESTYRAHREAPVRDEDLLAHLEQALSHARLN